MQRAVIVLGGYGVFGRRIAAALARERTHRILIAGRNGARARSAAAEIGESAEALVLDCKAADLATRLAALDAALVIHTAGPFQAQDYAVPRACIDAGPPSGETHKLLALASFLLNRLDDYRANMEKAIELDPRDAGAHYHLGRFHYESKNIPAAEKEFGVALGLDPDHYRAHYFTALCRQKKITIALMTDARFSGGSVGLVIGHVAPEACLGGPIALIQDGDEIVVDLSTDRLDCAQLADAGEYARRAAAWRAAADRNGGVHPDVKPVTNRLLKRMRATARPALQGAGMALG